MGNREVKLLILVMAVLVTFGSVQFVSAGVTMAVDIEKFTNGEDADTPTGPIIPVGATATFTYLVSNIGGGPLSDVFVIDDNGTPGNAGDDFAPTFTGGDANGNGLLDIDETWTYQASTTVTEGQYTNTAVVTTKEGPTDSDPSNHLGVLPTMAVDIKPDDDENSINPDKKGVIPVAIFGSETFDISNIDFSSLRFGPNGAEPVHNKGHQFDVNLDGIVDLIGHFRVLDSGIVRGFTEACLSGELFDGSPLEGCDSVRTVPER